jgi:hypothetical protein
MPGFRRIALAALVIASAAAAYWIVSSQVDDSPQAHRVLVGRYCLDCHNSIDRAGELSLEDADLAHVEASPDLWEAVIRKLRVRMMPPSDAAQPPVEDRIAMIDWLERTLDRAAAASPDPGPWQARRLNRAEYANAIRDLLQMEVDSTTLLPPDDSAYGFDNIADALNTSPVHVEQYLSAAGKLAALAVGDPDTGPAAQTFRFRQDASQNIPVVGMPVGTVGGGIARVVLPLDGEYRLDVTFFKSNLGALKGLELAHDIEIAVDGERVHLATIGGPDDFTELMRNITEAADAVEQRSSTRVPLRAGPHQIHVGFVYDGALQTSVRLQPYDRSSQDVLDVTGHPHIETLTVTGPFGASGPGHTPSREQVFVCQPELATAETATRSATRECATEILSRLARRAYRGMETPDDVDELLSFFERGSEERGFDAGIQMALERLLSSPKFLFRIERDPSSIESRAAYQLPDVELASRLSFFLWSSIPDEELLDLAQAGMLSDPDVLEGQVSRMLADGKARALVENFAGQWLYLRNLDSFVPNSVGFPNFDDNLRQGLRAETELFFESIVREDRGVVDLMTADYTFLNERVAKHYGVPGVYGSHFRRVTLEDEERWGLLGKGSILMVSSHTDRTSPVVRGKWVLENLLGAPPPAPPPDVPPLEDIDPEGRLSLRERLEAHRENPVCAACHATMDPIGFALENFDAVGAWREYENGFGSDPIDPSAELVGGTEVSGPVELRGALLANPELFVSTVVEKLMTYALGRGLGGRDMSAVRRILRDTADEEHRFSSIVLGIVDSVPFQMRQAPGDDIRLRMAGGEQGL